MNEFVLRSVKMYYEIFRKNHIFDMALHVIISARKVYTDRRRICLAM